MYYGLKYFEDRPRAVHLREHLMSPGKTWYLYTLCLTDTRFPRPALSPRCHPVGMLESSFFLSSLFFPIAKFHFLHLLISFWSFAQNLKAPCTILGKESASFWRTMCVLLLPLTFRFLVPSFLMKESGASVFSLSSLHTYWHFDEFIEGTGGSQWGFPCLSLLWGS